MILSQTRPDDQPATSDPIHRKFLRACLAFSMLIAPLALGVGLGIALVRSQAIPIWAACLFVVAIPFQMVAYGTNVSILQVICFALILIGSIPAALVMLKSRNEQSPLSARASSAATS